MLFAVNKSSGWSYDDFRGNHVGKTGELQMIDEKESGVRYIFYEDDGRYILMSRGKISYSGGIMVLTTRNSVYYFEERCEKVWQRDFVAGAEG